MKFKSNGQDNLPTEADIQGLKNGWYYQQFKKNGAFIRGRIYQTVPHPGRFGLWQTVKLTIFRQRMVDFAANPPKIDESRTPDGMEFKPNRYTLTRGLDGVLIYENEEHIIWLMPYLHTNDGLDAIYGVKLDERIPALPSTPLD